MSGKKYVPEGVYLVCDKGAKPSELRSLSYKETTLFGEHMCTKLDKQLIVNFDPFGACACSNGNPCTAPVTDWTNVTDVITLGGNDLLLENSELPCALGGKIKIVFTMAAALEALPKPKKSFWTSDLDDTLKDISDTVIDFEIGVAKGLWKGLKGTVTGIYDLAVWAGKHHPVYQMANPQGFVQQLQKDKETFTAIGNVAKKAGTWVYRNSVVNQLTNPSDFMLAQQENGVMLNTMLDKAANMNAEEWGEITGQIGFEVILEVATVGGAAALTVIKVADKSLDVVRVVNALDNATDAAKVLENADDLVDGGRALETIEDGISLQPMPEELGDVKYLVSKIKKITSKPFKWNPKHNFDEFMRQLKGQEAGLNSLTVDDFIKNRDEYLENGRSKLGSATQKRFRDQARANKVAEFRAKGYGRSEAKSMADDFMDNNAALHDPDQIAGGFGDNVTGMGDRGVNSSLGSQWKNNIDDIDSQVREVAESMTESEKKSTYLNIELTGG